ncbi:MAG: cytochrome c3 family protein, partial [Candidatus Aminicenantes bacterium]|nr:cytochrome c3 family protein [Candidatus Aminicenantes bacterium]
GLPCSSCHGGNPEKEAMDEAKDKSFKGIPSRKEIPGLCAYCHSDANFMRKYNPTIRIDQFELYLTSHHGQAFKKGDTKVALCTDCHGVHGLQSAYMPQSATFAWNIAGTCGRCHSNSSLMKEYTLPSKQEEDYRASIHAQALYEKKDLSAPTCNDCHDNHGAFPPEGTSVANVCRQCHPSPAVLFSQSPHKAAFDEMGMAECEACHGHHRIEPPTDELLPGGKKDICRQCHEENSSAFKEGFNLREKFISLASQLDALSLRLEKIGEKGIEIGEAKYLGQQARTYWLEARNLIHSLSLSEIQKKITESQAIMKQLSSFVIEAEKETRLRKTGLVIASLFLFLLAIALWLKAKKLRQKPL